MVFGTIAVQSCYSALRFECKIHKLHWATSLESLSSVSCAWSAEQRRRAFCVGSRSLNESNDVRCLVWFGQVLCMQNNFIKAEFFLNWAEQLSIMWLVFSCRRTEDRITHNMVLLAFFINWPWVGEFRLYPGGSQNWARQTLRDVIAALGIRSSHYIFLILVNTERCERFLIYLHSAILAWVARWNYLGSRCHIGKMCTKALIVFGIFRYWTLLEIAHRHCVPNERWNFAGNFSGLSSIHHSSVSYRIIKRNQVWSFCGDWVLSITTFQAEGHEPKSSHCRSVFLMGTTSWELIHFVISLIDSLTSEKLSLVKTHKFLGKTAYRRLPFVCSLLLAAGRPK